MNLKDLSILTGHKSVSDMTEEELRDHLHDVRKSRMTVKEKERTEKTHAPAKPRKAKTPNLDGMTQDQLRELIARIRGN